MKLRILSYNIHKGFTIGNTEFILQQIRHALREMNADILFLQQVQGDHHDKKWHPPEWKTAIQFEYLADTLWPHFSYGKNSIYPEGHHGNAILSKFPIVEWSNQIISTNRLEQRGLLKTKIRIPENGKEILLINTHLDLTQTGRDKQGKMIIESLLPEKDLPFILIGDFNDWNKRLTPTIEKELGAKEAFLNLHGKMPLTFPSFMPMLSLDRAFLHKLKASKAIALTDPHWRKLSDHIPLYLEIELPD